MFRGDSPRNGGTSSQVGYSSKVINREGRRGTSFSARDAVRASLRLLLPRDRRRLVIAACLQAATGVLDVIGVLLLGLVATLGTTTISKSSTPAPIQSTIDALGLT